MPGIRSTGTVACACAGTVWIVVTCDPSSFENVSVTGASDAFGFAISTSSSKNAPVAPSDK
jgi:hypothetical protein